MGNAPRTKKKACGRMRSQAGQWLKACRRSFFVFFARSENMALFFDGLDLYEFLGDYTSSSIMCCTIEVYRNSTMK